MKIYTKKGDQGTTSLVDNQRVSKDDPRVEAYGTIDELNAHIALICTLIEDKTCKKNLEEIERNLFLIQTELAIAQPQNCPFDIQHISKNDLLELEAQIDIMQQALPANKSFVMLDSHPIAAHCHIARTICRRSERRIVTLNRQKTVNPDIMSYINRLSDFLFVLARYICVLLNIQEKEVKLKK